MTKEKGNYKLTNLNLIVNKKKLLISTLPLQWHFRVYEHMYLSAMIRIYFPSISLKEEILNYSCECGILYLVVRFQSLLSSPISGGNSVIPGFPPIFNTDKLCNSLYMKSFSNIFISTLPACYVSKLFTVA
jgi:hypothetical protein